MSAAPGPAPRRLSRAASAVRASVFAELAPHLEAFTRAGGDLVPLHIGDTHLAPPAAARFARCEAPSAAAETFDAGLYQYGAVTGERALREAVSAYAGRAGRGAYDPQREVLLACGATHALFCGARAVLDPGDEVLVCAPYWPLSVGVLRAAGLEPVEVALSQALYEDPSRDVATLLEAARTERTRAVYVTSPNNPDGHVLTAAQRASLAAFLRRHDLWLLSDEVYADYAYVPEAHAAALRCLDDDPDLRARSLRVYSLSKSHALAGARVGALLADAAVVAAAQRVATHTVYNVPVASQRVALAALDEAAGDAWVRAASARYEAARGVAMEALEGSGLRFFAPHGGAYLFLDARAALDGRPLAALLERAIAHGVLLTPGGASGAGYEGFARLCFTAVPLERLREGVARLRRALATL